MWDSRKDWSSLWIYTTYFCIQLKIPQKTKAFPNMYMDNSEASCRAVSTASNQPSLWLGHVDGVIIRNRYWDAVCSTDSSIQFSIEPEVNDKLAFLDQYVNALEDATAQITLCLKPKQTDQHLNSPNLQQHKCSAISAWTMDYVATHDIQKQEDQLTDLTLKANVYI